MCQEGITTSRERQPDVTDTGEDAGGRVAPDDPPRAASRGGRDREHGAAARPAVAARRGPAFGWRLAFHTGAGHARGFLRFWPVWERIMFTFFPVQSIPDNADNPPAGVFLIRLARYHHGQPVTLPDGTHVGQGDWICEVHINNRRMAEYSERAQYARLLGDMAADLRAIAAYLAQAPEAAEVKSLWGRTLLSRGARRLGFTIRALPVTVHARFERFFMMGLMVLYHGRGMERLGRGTTRAAYPEEVWMSRGELLRRYGPK